jgi:RHS repeat-associated protein
VFGYRYDTETGLYYLQSRYYNPEWGRFINADDLGGTVGELLSHNVFAYCGNNPINREDPDGHFWQIVGALVGAAAGAVIAGANTDWNWKYMLAGAAAGALVGAGLGYIAEIGYAAIVGAGGTAATMADKLKYSQTTASPNFSEEGKFAGNTIGQVAQKIRSGVIKPIDVPVEYISRGNNNLILNTRSSLALKRASISIDKWNLINRTGDSGLEAHLTQRLMRNGLTNTGTDVIRITGFGQNASSLK